MERSMTFYVRHTLVHAYKGERSAWRINLRHGTAIWSHNYIMNSLQFMMWVRHNCGNERALRLLTPQR
jgi:hypothetical protein